ncbi:hypothetical protein AJ80_09098 [Polytolypa hystricis UAMH7299]|uniref:FAD-binding PCMH-type domain-containing protein n=1 Tax=Polytolypa hystricis (strain UAMH7299) TaxID=1447883 RepID=A0A2B7WVU9_POLH7|nr:hypothetical protein AJ80_09098 [Polytolypa hystricis UAMH7299]
MVKGSNLAAILGGLLFQASRGAAASCCSQLNTQLGGKVHLPESRGYNVSMEGFWTLQAIYETPTCVLVPESAEDVAAAVKTLVGGNCKFSIKGGGHTPFPGAASISDGVQIDMTSIKSVSVDKEKTVASVGAGARWLTVYRYLES